jgi:penicillin amidase
MEDATGPVPTELNIDGLSSAASVSFDEWGVLHASCETDTDCAAVLGYFHARDRFAQMDLRRRLTTGRIGTLAGALALDIDISNRTIFTTQEGVPIEEAMLESVSAESLAILEAYSAGVNSWLGDLAAGENGAVLSDEYNFPLVSADVIPPWEPKDCLSTVVALVDSLTNTSSAEIRYGEAYAALTADVAGELYGPRSVTDSTILSDFVGPAGDKANEGPALGETAFDAGYLRRASGLFAEAAAAEAARSILTDDGEGARGSNNWIVGPSLSASGNALLSNDPHLGLSNPSIWYLATMDAVTNGSGTWHAGGMSFAGLPWIIIGQNSEIAWGATNTNFDQSDVYVETLSEDGTGVLFNGEVVPFIEREFIYELTDADTETRTSLYVPHHGPVLAIDEEAGTALTLRWTGNNLSTDAEFLTQLMRAGTIDEARDAISLVTSIGQNWVVADRGGNIGWFPYNNVPTRSWVSQGQPSWIPLPGDGSAEWGEYYPLEDLPQALNPEQGYLATANNDMTGEHLDGDPTNDGWSIYQGSVAAGFRHARIVDLLEEDSQHTPDSMLRIIADNYSLFGETLRPVLLEATEGAELSPAAASLRDAYATWGFLCPTGLSGIDPQSEPSADAIALSEAVGCTAFHAWYGNAEEALFGDEVDAEILPSFPRSSSTILMFVRPEALPASNGFWDDVATEDIVETRDAIILRGLEAAAAQLVDELGEDSSGWLWGRLHTLNLRADLFSNLGVPNFDNGDYANDGGDYTVDVANTRNPAAGDFSHRSGASMRMVCEAGDPAVSCQVQLPGGQSHFRDSANYQDLLERWLVNDPIPLHFLADDVQAAAVSIFAASPDDTE